MISRKPDTIANLVRMLRQQHQGSFLIVEGADDRLWFDKFVDRMSCKIVVAEGKANVLGTIAILDVSGFRGALGIIDSDFDYIEGRMYESHNVLVTDLHDLEAILVKSPALDALLTEFGSSDKLGAFPDIRETLLLGARHVAHLRLHSERSQLGLRFEGIQYHKFMHRDTVAIDIAGMITEVLNKSQRHDLNGEDLASGMAVVAEQAHSDWHLCSGPDLIGILSHGLRHAFGTNSANAVSDAQLRRSLRLAFLPTHLKALGLFANVRAWEAANCPYLIFAAGTGGSVTRDSGRQQ